ncbi:MAG: hypothetical protein M1822_009474 [Bathelium mastoideum]|nr:MAG: hypothetical protein M1822_009474 [Bathelium mastoideum]
MSVINGSPDLLSIEAKGGRTLMGTLDRWAEVKPDKVYCWIPINDEISNGFRGVTVGEMAKAIDSCAWWIRNNYGTSDCFETLAYMGTYSDLRYMIFYFAAVKCGYKCLTPSPSNAMVQNARLLHLSNCIKIFHAPEVVSIVQQLQTQIPGLKAYPLKYLDHWTQTYSQPYPYTKTFEDAKWDPTLVMHSSGSTGPPKLIVLNHGVMSRLDMPAPPLGGRTSGYLPLCEDGNYLAPFPVSHLAGMTSLTAYAVFCQNSAVVLLPPTVPPTPQVILEAMQRIKVHTLYLPPSLIEGVANLADGIHHLSQLRRLIYAGGPLLPAIGNKLTHHVSINCIYGATETSGVLLVHHPRGDPDWAYLHFHPAYHAIFEPVALDGDGDDDGTGAGAAELVYRRATPEELASGAVDKDYDRYWGVFWTQQDVTEYRTHDLFVPHPDPAKKGLWRFYGRTDDTIILASGRKFNPIAAENTIAACPLLTGAMVVGEGREEKAVLVEPAEDVGKSEEEKEQFADEVWKWVEKANEEMMTDKVIGRGRVAVVKKGGFVRAAKGTVVRKLTGEKYRDVVDGIYGEAVDMGQMNWHGE